MEFPRYRSGVTSTVTSTLASTVTNSCKSLYAAVTM